MQTIGEKLSEKRQRSGILLREAAENTKIRGEFLEFLENNQFDRIPLADVYKRGFLKIYARFLQLDVERLLSDYNTQTNSNVPVRPGAAGASRRSSYDAASGNLAGGNAEAPGADFPSSVAESGSRPTGGKKVVLTQVLWGIGLFLLVVAVIFSARKIFTGKTTQPQAEAPVVVDDGTYPLRLSLVEAHRRQTVVTITQDEDGREIFNGYLKPGEIQTRRARGALIVKSQDISKVQVHIGNRYFHQDPNDTTSSAFIINKDSIQGALGGPVGAGRSTQPTR